MDWVRNARRLTEFSVLRVVFKHMSIFAFLQVAMIATHNSADVLLSIAVVESLRRIVFYRASFDSMRGIFPELSSSIMTKKAIACEICGFDMFFSC